MPELTEIKISSAQEFLKYNEIAAKNLKEAQKGVMLAGGLKLFSPLIMVLPGIISYHI